MSGKVREEGDRCLGSRVRTGQEGRIRNGADDSREKTGVAVKSKKGHACNEMHMRVDGNM